MKEISENRKKSIFERFLLLMPLGNGTAEEALLLWLMISVWVDYVTSGVIMVAVFMTMIFSPKARAHIRCEKTMFFLGVAIGAFSFAVSAIAKNLIGLAISFGVFLVITVGAYAKNVMNVTLFKKLGIICCVGSVVSTLIALYQNFIKNGISPLYRPTALAFNPNYYGTITVMTLLICVYNMLDAEKTEEKRWYTQNKLFYAVIFLINLVSLMVGESRSSLMALMICCVFYMLITKRYVLFAIVAAVVAGAVTVGWFFPDVFSWTNSLKYSFDERVNIWMEALRSFSQNAYTVILGRGPMTYYLVKEAEGLHDAMHAHNLFIDFLLNVGVIGTAMYALLFIYFIKELLRVFKDKNKAGFVVASIFVLEILAQGIADVTIIWHQCATLFVLGFAMVGAQRKAE